MDNPFIPLIILLFAHWVGDYLLQTTPMALRKGSSFYWLTVHVLVYTGTLLTFSFFIFTWNLAIKFALVNGLLHWIVDFITSRVVVKYKDRPRIYYPIIGLDQFSHISLLVYTFQFLYLGK